MAAWIASRMSSLQPLVNDEDDCTITFDSLIDGAPPKIEESPELKRIIEYTVKDTFEVTNDSG
jgi:hypothetical protein